MPHRDDGRRFTILMLNGSSPLICDSSHTDVLKLARVPLSLVATLASLASISEISFLDCSYAFRPLGLNRARGTA
jgi:hypothetical protein